MNLRHKDVVFFDLAHYLMIDCFHFQELRYHIFYQIFLLRFCLAVELLAALVADYDYFNQATVIWSLVSANVLPKEV